MKTSLKYTAAIVMVTLIGVTCYQVYWLSQQYVERRVQIERQYLNYLTWCDYEEISSRIHTLMPGQGVSIRNPKITKSEMNMSTIKVLLAEDEEALALIIQKTLDMNGFAVTIAGDGKQALDLVPVLCPDVIVADVMMPGIDGFELVKRLRRKNISTPLLFLTARSAIDDVVRGFEAGANDYLKKPFSMRELIVRLKALAIRNKPGDLYAAKDSAIEIGEYIFKPHEQQLEAFGIVQDLSFRETRLLLMLSSAPNAVVSTRDILMELWGDDSIYNQRSLHVFITKLRKKMSHDKNVRIVNARSVGYKLIVLP